MAGLLGGALERMRDNGVLVADVDVKALATGLLAAVEGGYLLSQTGRDPRLMQSALNMAIGHVASFATARPAERGRRPRSGPDRPIRGLVVAGDGRRGGGGLCRGRGQV